MRIVLGALILFGLVGCSNLSDTLDSGDDTDFSFAPDATADGDFGLDVDSAVDSVPASEAFRELASPWTTRLRDAAGIPRIYLEHRGWVVVYADNDGTRGEALFHTRVSQFNP